MNLRDLFSRKAPFLRKKKMPRIKKLEDLIGSTAITLTIMNPFGLIKIEDHVVEGISKNFRIPVDTIVWIKDVEMGRLVVEIMELKPNNP